MKKLMKDGMMLAKTGLGLSVMSSATSGLGGGEALGEVSAAMPTVGGIVAAGNVLRILKNKLKY